MSQSEAIYEEVRKLLRRLPSEQRRRLVEEIEAESKDDADMPAKKKAKAEILEAIESLVTAEIRSLDGRETVIWLREDRAR